MYANQTFIHRECGALLSHNPHSSASLVFCLDHGIGVESVDKDGDTSLDFACMKSKFNAVKVKQNIKPD